MNRIALDDRIRFYNRVNKRAVIEKIIDQLREELSIYHKAARAAHAEATHEQSKAENKYDTRGLEASYLARGQSRQAAEIMQAIEEFEKLGVRTFTKEDAIDVGALVQLKGNDGESFYFIGPRAGGTEVMHDKKEILVITPQSPLGQQLMGKGQGNGLHLTIGATKNRFEIVSVS